MSQRLALYLFISRVVASIAFVINAANLMLIGLKVEQVGWWWLVLFVAGLPAVLNPLFIKQDRTWHGWATLALMLFLLVIPTGASFLDYKFL